MTDIIKSFNNQLRSLREGRVNILDKRLVGACYAIKKSGAEAPLIKVSFITSRVRIAPRGQV